MTDNMFKMGKTNGSTKLDFQTYKQTLSAVAGIKDFGNALLWSLPIANPAVASYQNNIQKWKLAWNYLKMTLDGSATAVMERTTTGDPYDA